MVKRPNTFVHETCVKGVGSETTVYNDDRRHAIRNRTSELNKNIKLVYSGRNLHYKCGNSVPQRSGRRPRGVSDGTGPRGARDPNTAPGPYSHGTTDSPGPQTSLPIPHTSNFRTCPQDSAQFDIFLKKKLQRPSPSTTTNLCYTKTVRPEPLPRFISSQL